MKMRHLNRSFVCLLIEGLVFLSYFPRFCSKVSHLSNILESSDYTKLSKSRVIIDDAISEKQLKSLLTFINHDQVLSKGNAITLLPETNTYVKFAYTDLNSVYSSLISDLQSSHNGHINTNNRHERILNSTSTLKYMHIMKDILDVQLRILDYAESFFSRKLRIQCGKMFVRRQAKLEDSTEKNSPSKLNNGSGWLVPVHVDTCKFREDLWACDYRLSKREINDFLMRNFSVVLFLNEIEENLGGEFVFIDAPGREVGSISSVPHTTHTKKQQKHPQQPNQQLPNRELSHNYNEEIDTDYQLQYMNQTGNLIPPPSRALIKQALDRQRRNLIDTNGITTKSVSVYESGINYTVVVPKVRRLVIFNSSAENIHGATQILNSHDRRYTLFMFISEVAEDNV